MIKSLFGAGRGAASRKPAAATRRPARRQKGLGARIGAAGDRIAFSWTVREGLYRHLSAQVFNGVAVEVALDSYRLRLKRRNRPSSDKIVGDIARRMRDGSTFAAAVGMWAPQDEVSVLSSGEMAGNLPRSLDLLIDAKRRVARVNKAIKSALMRPTIYAAIMYAMLWGIGRFVVPGLQQVLPSSKAHGLVYGLYAAGDFANSWLAVVPPLVVAMLAICVVQALPRWTGARRVWAEKFFPFSFYRDTHGYTWLMSFSALLGAGMADVEILKRQAKSATPWLKERLQGLWWRMDNGASLSAAMLSKGRHGMPPLGFPNPDIVDDIASMAGFADFSDRIAVVATQWAEELESATLAMANAFGIWMELLMYLVMGLLMAAINSMSGQLGTMPGM